MRWIELPLKTERRHTKLDRFVFSSRVRLARNLEGLKFPMMLSDKDKYDIDERLGEVFASLGDDIRIINFENMPPEKRMLYLGNRVLSEEFIKEGRKIAYEENGNWVAMINETDHIRLYSWEQGFNLSKMYARLSRVLDLIEKDVHFAFDERYGYLTSSIMNMGTGLRLSVLVNLYGLMANKEIERLVENLGQMGYTLVNYAGENGDSGFFILYHLYSLGLPEKEMVREITDLVEKVYAEENKARAEYFNDPDELDICYEELLELGQQESIDWDNMLYYISLIDAMKGSYLNLKGAERLREMVFHATDSELIYQEGVEEADVKKVRMNRFRRIISDIRYKVFA